MSPLKRITFWSNRANDAYAMGEADWVHDCAGNASVPLLIAEHALDERPGDWDFAAEAVERECKRLGIDPKRHRWHPPR